MTVEDKKGLKYFLDISLKTATQYNATKIDRNITHISLVFSFLAIIKEFNVSCYVKVMKETYINNLKKKEKYIHASNDSLGLSFSSH